MQDIIDARGLSCPEPVILTKKALDEAGNGFVTTVVDNTAALENVSRLAKGLGYSVEVEQRGEDYHVRIDKTGTRPDQMVYNRCVILVTSQFLGQGDDALGRTLMRSFHYTLTQMEGMIGSIIFMNSGVVLTTKGSEVLEHLLSLEKAGVGIWSCGTCLEFYNLKEQLAVGQISNMYSIMEMLFAAPKVISL
ncbi:MAG: sulfurtransferase-like selenium metabolism protein YedF [Syntrophomonadaceae bacterium]|nr:sulfurtransferase-like selenium metabolism protein YedF [Syntrophomonadaceae bacterium]